MDLEDPYRSRSSSAEPVKPLREYKKDDKLPQAKDKDDFELLLNKYKEDKEREQIYKDRAEQRERERKERKEQQRERDRERKEREKW
jgi:trichohyalin